MAMISDSLNKLKEVFLIEQIRLDPSENESARAVRYEPEGWVSTEQEAQGIVNKGGTFRKSDCWAIIGKMPEFRYKKLTKCTM